MIIRLKYFNDSPNIVFILAPSREFFCANCSISFNIYGMKLNEVHFSTVTVIIHFLDKTLSRNKFQKSFRYCTTL